MARVVVSQQVLRWAMDRSDQTMADLKPRFPKIGEWITGDFNPTLRQLETFAKATRTPLGFFFLDEPPNDSLTIPHFRTLGDESPERPSPDLLETVQTLERRQSWIREYLIEQGYSPIPFVGSVTLDDNYVDVAHRIRSVLGLTKGWAATLPTWSAALRELLLATEEAGIFPVVNGIVGNNTSRRLDPEEFRGFVLADEYAPFIFVNNADAKAAQIFTVAHELAHTFLGVSAAFDLHDLQPAGDPTEEFCNRVAAEFLVPAEEMDEIWPKVADAPTRFERLARTFKVSTIVVARRALSLNLISRNQFFLFYGQYRSSDNDRDTRRPSDGGNYYANQNYRIGRRFATTVMAALEEGRIQYTEAYRLTGLNMRTFHEYASRLESGDL